ncbi:hypothetical protein ACL9RF_02570 [Sphingobacterium sp. Mn56C]|uniref:hypothetical protein n=1 Tax=Sphingobacterium sp. Mn56C TaxID=3395261 RepID=UPI003BBA6925
MYAILLMFHSGVRWLLLGSLLYALFMAVKGLLLAEPFGRTAHGIRSLTVTLAHLQLMMGMLMYIKSPFVGQQAFEWPTAWPNPYFFFRYIHIGLMILAVVLLTIGSSKVKRTGVDSQQYRLLLLWFLAAFVVMFLAIPWPFSPLAARPYLPVF